jgi:hypothetical protein
MGRRLINSMTVINIIVLLVTMKAKEVVPQDEPAELPPSPEAATDTVSHYVPVEDSSGSNGNTNTGNPQNPQNPQPENKINFGRLELKTELLKGARWAIEEFAEGDQIEVYYSIEIVDISKVDVETMSIR